MSKILLINPGNRKQVFQSLGKEAAAIEPPFWVAVIGAYLRQQGHQVKILDANAENLSPQESAGLALEFSPDLSVIVVYGSQPSASTQNMPSAGAICKELRHAGLGNIMLSGLHPSALPLRTMQEEHCDFVAQGEGILSIEALLFELDSQQPDFSKVPGLWWRENAQIRHNPPAPLIENLDFYLPVAAWDLLPMQLYRAHDWHCFDNLELRQHYAAIYTSLGCPFNCEFCCINTPFGKPGIRYRSPELVLQEIDLLVQQHQIRNLKIVDELFVLHKEHYLPIVKGLIQRDYGLNIWAYARVDTIDFELLPAMKQAGINWLALGIESANAGVRKAARKGGGEVNVSEVCAKIQEAGINVIGNFIFGLPEDSLETMQETLDLALQLNCEFANFYSVMAYPGSKLYDSALAKYPERLPETWSGYSQHSFDCRPLANEKLSAAQILRFRDQAFQSYYNNESYLALVEKKFGSEIRKHIVDNAKTSLPRQLYS